MPKVKIINNEKFDPAQMYSGLIREIKSKYVPRKGEIIRLELVPARTKWYEVTERFAAVEPDGEAAVVLLVGEVSRTPGR